MDLLPSATETLPEEPPALVQKAVHMETGIELSTYNWLLQLVQAIQNELDAYEKGDEDEQNRAIFHQRRLLNNKWMPPLSEEDMQIFIARLPSKTIADIMTTMCQNKRAIEEARARYETEIAEILKTDGHIINQLLFWTNRRFTEPQTHNDTLVDPRREKAKRNSKLIIGKDWFPTEKLF